MYVIGVDIGGTSTRVVLAGTAATGPPGTGATPEPEIAGTGQAGGGNPVSHGPQPAARELAAALHQALTGHDPAEVATAVIGMAGVGPASGDPQALAAFASAWRRAGLTCPYRLVPDPLVSYASASGAPDGTVLVAGTGAVAGEVRGYELVRLADGHGWLLGDAGSGYWLGREAVRAALADLDRQRPLAELSALVLTELLGSAEVTQPPRATVSALVGAVNAAPPVRLSRLAPLVSRAYAAGDPVAVGIVEAAADALSGTAEVVRPPGATSPLVLAGGLLTRPDSALAGVLAARLSLRWPHAPLRQATDGGYGAARLAARDLHRQLSSR